MKCAFIDRFGGPDALHAGEQPGPECGPHDLLVQVKAASINPVDWKIREGKLKLMIKYPLPLILGQDLSGVVVKVGAKVSRFKSGDEVFARLDKAHIGAFAQYAALRESDAAMKPSNLTHVEAASIPLVGLTSWQVMRDMVGLKPGQFALIHAGSGGVGTFAIQLAKYLGATVATTVGSKNIAMVKKLGADIAIDYRTQRFEDVAGKADFIFDTQGGETLMRSVESIKPGGTVITIGGIPTSRVIREWGLAGWKEWLVDFLNRKVSARAKSRGVKFDYHFMSPSGQQLAAISKLLEDGKILPVIDQVYRLDQAKDAFAHAEAGHAVGKVIITP